MELKHLLGKREKQEHKVIRELEGRVGELQPEYHRPAAGHPVLGSGRRHAALLGIGVVVSLC